MANDTTNNVNLASNELTNLVTRIVIPDDTSEGSHSIAEYVGDMILNQTGGANDDDQRISDGLSRCKRTSSVRVDC